MVSDTAALTLSILWVGALGTLSAVQFKTMLLRRDVREWVSADHRRACQGGYYARWNRIDVWEHGVKALAAVVALPFLIAFAGLVLSVVTGEQPAPMAIAASYYVTALTFLFIFFQLKGLVQRYGKYRTRKHLVQS